MIDYIHEMCLDWGAYMRRNPKCWSDKSPSWRLFRDHGAKGNMTKAKEPSGVLQIFKEENADIAEIHRIWRDMPEDISNAMVAFYIKRCSPRKKAEMLGVSTAALYFLRSHAHYYIAGRFDQKNDQ